jgi:hypothetical protein
MKSYCEWPLEKREIFDNTKFDVEEAIRSYKKGGRELKEDGYPTMICNKPLIYAISYVFRYFVNLEEYSKIFSCYLSETQAGVSQEYGGLVCTKEETYQKHLALFEERRSGDAKLSKRRKGSTKVPGVYFKKGGYITEISTKSGTKHVGSFSRIQEAIEARLKAEIEYTGGEREITRGQYEDLLSTFTRVRLWMQERARNVCLKCFTPIQLITSERLKEEKHPLCYLLDQKQYDEIIYPLVNTLYDDDVICCLCGGVFFSIADIFYYGFSSTIICSRFKQDYTLPDEEMRERLLTEERILEEEGLLASQLFSEDFILPSPTPEELSIFNENIFE